MFIIALDSKEEFAKILAEARLEIERRCGIPKGMLFNHDSTASATRLKYGVE